jgi:hypothetical protein
MKTWLKSVIVLAGILSCFVASTANATVWADTKMLIKSCTDPSPLSQGVCFGIIMISAEITSDFVICYEGEDSFLENQKGCDGTRQGVNLPDNLTVGDIRNIMIEFILLNPESFEVNDSATVTIFKALVNTYGTKTLAERKRI